MADPIVASRTATAAPDAELEMLADACITAEREWSELNDAAEHLDSIEFKTGKAPPGSAMAHRKAAAAAQRTSELLDRLIETPGANAARRDRQGARLQRGRRRRAE